MTASVGTDEFAAGLALANIGEPGIAAMADNTKRARVIRQFFPVARDQLLRLKDWNFASAWHLPSADTVPGVGPFKIRYPMPSYCVRIREVEGCTERDWAVESAVADVQGAAVDVEILVTNIIDPNVRITRNDIPVRLWDGLFLPAFGHMLAYYCATRLGKSQTTADRQRQNAIDLISSAATVDSKERGGRPQRQETSWAVARRGGGRFRTPYPR